MKENFLKAIVLLMTGVIVFCSATMLFSAAEVTPEPPTTVTTEAPTEPTAEPSESNSATESKPTESTPAATATTDEDDFDYTVTSGNDRATTTKYSSKTTTKAPTSKKPSSTRKPSSAGKPATTLVGETTSEETSAEYTDELYDDTTAYIWTFAEETTEAENQGSNVNIKKIVIIAVIVVAVIGAGVCLFILGKKK